jgi:large subunit ribosomal protein L5
MSEEKALKEKYKNPMLKPQLEKVTVNISVGRSGLPLENAVKILEALTGQKPCKRKAKKTIRDFGIRKGEPIACMVTLRGDKAVNFLKIAFQAIGDRLLKKSFDNQGNFSFGIKEHIEIPGVKYFPKLGIYGMDVSATLGRLGYRVKRRHRAKSKIGLKHVLKRDEAITFLKEEFGVQITG